MNFDFSEDQWTIKRTARELLTKRVTLDRVRELGAAGRHDDALWQELCDLGWPGIFADERFGGEGLGIVELVAVVEELGRALAPVPMLSSVSAALILHEAGTTEQQERWLPGILTGTTRASAGTLSDGRARAVPDGAAAQVLYLVDDEGRGTLLEPGPGEAVPLATLDLTRRFASITPGGGEELPGDAAAGRDLITIMLAAEVVGTAERALDMAVEYASERKQFDRPIGTYQAVSHACARMLLDVESARSLTYYAAWVADSEREQLPVAAAMAGAYAADAGWRVCASALQILGGIGFTWEHDIHLLLRRTKVAGSLFSTARRQREVVAGAMLSPAPV